jgi:hypothetical protein
MHGKRLDWQTAVSHIRFLRFVSIVDNGHLAITVESPDNEESKLYTFTWKKFFAYRNILEENGVPWDLQQDIHPGLSGCTHKIDDSPWIAEMKARGDYLELLHPSAEHFVFCTSDYVTEVVSGYQPDVNVQEDSLGRGDPNCRD